MVLPHEARAKYGYALRLRPGSENCFPVSLSAFSSPLWSLADRVSRSQSPLVLYTYFWIIVAYFKGKFICYFKHYICEYGLVMDVQANRLF